LYVLENFLLGSIDAHFVENVAKLLDIKQSSTIFVCFQESEHWLGLEGIKLSESLKVHFSLANEQFQAYFDVLLFWECVEGEGEVFHGLRVKHYVVGFLYSKLHMFRCLSCV